MASSTLFLACLLAMLLSSQAVEMTIASKNACKRPHLDGEAVPPQARLSLKAAPWTCQYRSTCRGLCIKHGRGPIACQPNCRGCMFCKGCNETGYCQKRKQCAIKCVHYPCLRLTYCRCVGISSLLQCRNAPITPWCTGGRC